MKISVFTGHPLTHPEVDIRCKDKDREVDKIQRALQACENRLVGKSDERTVLLNPSQVLYFEVVDRKTFAYTKADTAEVKNRLNELTDVMFYGYIRISKSMVINVIHITKVVRLLNGNLDITLDNDEHVLISRRYVSEFNQFINNGGN